MANPTIITGFANPDPNAAPLNIVELVKLLNQLVQSVMVGSYIPYVIGHDTPGTEDQDKAWIKLSTTKKPLAVMTFYNGKWRRVYNGMLGEVRIYSGDPTDATDGFDEDGRGIVEGEYDGWHLCNGNDGTPDLSDKFILPAHMNIDDGHPMWNATQGWLSFINGVTSTHTGGRKDNVLTAATTYQPAKPALQAGKWAADGNAHSTSGQMWGDIGGGTTFDLIAADPGVPVPQPIENVPPYIALGFIIFVGYV
jgi:hypothetical protein